MLGKSIKQVLTVNGDVRPEKEKGHEHFVRALELLSQPHSLISRQGFLDNISLPAIPSLTGQLPGQQVVPPGILVLGQEGDPELKIRPSWAKNGSFLAWVNSATSSSG